MFALFIAAAWAAFELQMELSNQEKKIHFVSLFLCVFARANFNHIINPSRLHVCVRAKGNQGENARERERWRRTRVENT